MTSEVIIITCQNSPQANIGVQINLPQQKFPDCSHFLQPDANNIHDNKLEGLAIVIAGGIEYHKMAEYKGSEQNTNTEQGRVRL